MFNPSRPAPFILVSTDNGMMIVNRMDYSMQGDGAIGVSVELFNFSHYDDAQLGLICQLMDMRREAVGDGMVVLDGGANIGCYTIEFAKRMSGWGTVIAFEPQDWAFRALCGATCINNCLNTKVFRAALGASRGEIEVPAMDQTMPCNFGGVELNHGVRGDVVDLVAIDDLNFPRLDLLKLDIEGMELDALRGAKKTLDRCKPMLCIEHIKCGMDVLVNMLQPFGYVLQMTGMNVLGLHESDPVSKRIRWYDSKAA